MKLKNVLVELELGSSVKEGLKEAISFSLDNECDVEFEANGENYIIDYKTLTDIDRYKEVITR